MITEDEIRRTVVPFKVRRPGKKRVSVVVRLTQNDPLGVGGGIFPDMPTAHFKNGGWLLVKDLMQHFELVKLD